MNYIMKLLLFFVTFIALSQGCSLHKSEVHELDYQAQAGNIRAQSELGDLYLFGEQDNEVDYKKAFYWYKKAADQGDAKSQYNLAIMYLNGYGIEMNKSKAVEYYRKSAEQGDSDSQLQLGIRYLNGEGVSQDLKLAKYWLNLSMKNGNVEAEQYLKK